MSTKTFPRNLLTAAFAEMNQEPDDVRESSECFGVVVDSTNQAMDLAAALGIVAANDDWADNGGDSVDLVQSLIRSACTDNMGLSLIVYFPGWGLG